MTKREPFTPMLPMEMNAAIGAFITTWSNVAGLLTMLISNLSAGKTLGPTDDMTASLAHIGMEVRVQLGLIKTMGAARLGPKHEAELRKICDRLERSKAMRDKFAHAPWALKKGRPVAHMLKTVGKVSITIEHVTVDQVVQETQRLVELVGDLIVLVQKHGFLADYQLSSGV